jgi:Raf kinase inhibitor-like YbhB/YbcL family protein
MKYQGPCPPSGTHHYFFRVYALDTLLNISPGSLKTHVETAMKDHILAKGELMGLYHKTQVEAK